MSYDKPHLVLKAGTKQPYMAPSNGGGAKGINRDREEHVKHLRSQLSQIKSIQEGEITLVTLKGKANERLLTDPAAGKSTGSEVLVKKRLDNQDIAVIRLTKKGLDKINTKLAEYETITVYPKDQTKSPKAKHEDFINSIENISQSLFKDLFEGNSEYLPQDDSLEKWWEIWITGGELQREVSVASRRSFREACEDAGIEVDIRKYIALVDSQALIVKASIDSLKAIISGGCDVLTSIRPPSLASAQLCALNGHDIADVQSIVPRINIPEPNAPRVTVIDTGVSSGHPLLQSVIPNGSLHTVDPSSTSTADYHSQGHGTSVVSSAAFGDLAEIIRNQDPIQLEHFTESVRVALDNNASAPELWGKTTIDAVRIAESGTEEINRVFNLSIGCNSGYHDGGVTSWSESIDRLAYNEGIGRLITVAAGNLSTSNINASTYPFENLATEIDDPGQALNSICVGAYTDMVNWLPEVQGYAHLIPPNNGHSYIAIPGGLSPHSRTGRAKSAIKPEIVCEGGNIVADGTGKASFFDSPGISGLTANHTFNVDGAFKQFYATSMAAPFAARMLAIIWARNPQYNAATIRALLIHSAEWTTEMKRLFPNTADRVRACGYGVPNLEKACMSASSSVTLISEDSLSLRKRNDPQDATAPTRDMAYYKLPWPKEQLLDMGEEIIELRVTLSYFTEPNSRLAAKEYQGASLAWELQGSLESDADFLKRINKKNRKKGEKGFKGSIDWEVGPRMRNNGTVQSDRWRGTAAELASCEHIAVYPKKLGWWESNRKRLDFELNYSIVISIQSDNDNINLYSAIRNIILSEATASTTNAGSIPVALPSGTQGSLF